MLGSAQWLFWLLCLIFKADLERSRTTLNRPEISEQQYMETAK